MSRRERLEAEALRWARAVASGQLVDDMEGAFNLGSGLILLSDRLNPRQYDCVLAHEISHARHRDPGRCDRLAHDAVERRADMDAARLLVDGGEYARLERINDDAGWIAREMDVTRWVVDAWRMVLHDRGDVPCFED